MSITLEDVKSALTAVVDPNTHKDFVTSKAVKNIQVDGGNVALDIALGYPAKSQVAGIRAYQDRVGARHRESRAPRRRTAARQLLVAGLVGHEDEPQRAGGAPAEAGPAGGLVGFVGERCGHADLRWPRDRDDAADPDRARSAVSGCLQCEKGDD